MLRSIPWAVFGLAAGFAVGLAIGQSTRSKVGENVKTETRDGKLIITVDAGAAARAGLADFLG